jgi:hypothetical protein
MRKIMMCVIVALLAINLLPIYATPDRCQPLSDVDISFQSGIGIQMLITNQNDVAIRNVSIGKELIIERGYPIVSHIWLIETIPQIDAGASDTLNMLSFGLPGYHTVTATITYEKEGYTLTQSVQGHLIMLGFFTLVL